MIGVDIQPLSGALDLLSKTTKGANAMCMKLCATISLEQQALRRRLPLVIGGDNMLHPYDEYKARGQVCHFFTIYSSEICIIKIILVQCSLNSISIQVHQSDMSYNFFSGVDAVTRERNNS